MLLTLLFESPLVFAMVIGALIASISIHEFAHAFVADKLGDPTARYLGRVTLNPKSHLDPLGTLLLIVAGFGWGRPVPFNPQNLLNPRRDGALIALAGPCSNFILAVLLALVYHVLDLDGVIGTFVYLVIFYNLVLGVFNLIPVEPLDGFKIVNGILPSHLAIQWQQTAPYGIYILLFLVVTRTTSLIVQPVIELLLGILGLS